ncbi:putative cucumisin [Helianthus annuus]|uniref:Cucumisin n=2 Tax=Helianthus annuus TaxID=4232 RepID=A0A9K3HRQ1_HELAN|nr:putative cucumisin [Helianthus annuus]KAJ0876225.1 putative cucumisin [Helianthus annuus]
MGSLPDGEYSPSMHHSQIIKKFIHPSFASHALIRSYKRSFNGFAAYLTEEEKQKLTRIDGVVSVFPCEKSQLQTIRSWDFMGISRSIE